MSEQWQWLETTKQLQGEHFGVDYDKLECNGEELINYIKTQIIALQDELFEFLGELNWKPWSRDHLGVRDRAAAIGELVDVEHFLANIYVALGVTDREHEAKYREKQQRNARRQMNGNYTISAYKCPHCDRELDKPGAVTPILDAHDASGRLTNKIVDITVDNEWSYLYRCVSCAQELHTPQPICRLCGTITDPMLSDEGLEICSNCEVVLV